LIADSLHDIRYALRLMRRAPLFAATAIVTLALAIGANTAVFSLVNTLMLRRLPVREPERLVELLSRYPGDPESNSFSWASYERFRDTNHVFAHLIGTTFARFELSIAGAGADTISGEYVVGDFFSALGVRPAIGRLIEPGDDRPGITDAAVVVSWAFWKARFNLSPAVVGTQLRLDDFSATIVGVADRRFEGLEVGAVPDIWVPAAVDRTIRQANRRANGQLAMKLIGRLKPGVSIEQARAEMSLLDRWRVQEMANLFGNPQWLQARIGLESAAAGLSTLRGLYAKPLLAVLAIVVLLTAIACINVASLLIARGAARQREIAVRIALGAGRARLFRQLVTESVVLSAIATAAGIVVAFAATHTLIGIMSSGRPIIGLPQRVDIHVNMDVHVLLFTAAIACVTGLLFGFAPAWHATGTTVRGTTGENGALDSLRAAGTATDTKSRRRAGHALVIAQVALSLVVLSAAGLFVRHLTTLRNADTGFDRDSVLLVSLNPQGSGYDRVELSRRYEQLLARIHAIAGVRAATVSAVTPIQGAGAARFARVEGVEEKPEDRRYISLNWIGPRYFETLRTPLVAGRDFTFDDAGRSPVAIVNLAFARRYFSTAAAALGKHVTFDRDPAAYEIVGVAGDAKYLSLHKPAPPMLYTNAFQDRGGASQFAVRTTVAPSAVANEVRRAIQDVLKTVRVTTVTTLAEQVDASVVPERLMAAVSSFFGALGILLAALGVYGLLAYTVARRTTEIGVRMALGATERDVVLMVLRTAALLVGIGLVIGFPLAFWSLRVAAAMLETPDTVTMLPTAFAAALLAAVALLAAWLPARRASRIQPLDALRTQ
jgi:putative ABC transport system permease protein